MKNIYALTSAGSNLPGYISLNDCPQAGITLSVRSDLSGQGGFMKMELLQLQDLHAAIGKHLESVAPVKKKGVTTPTGDTDGKK